MLRARNRVIELAFEDDDDEDDFLIFAIRRPILFFMRDR